MTDNTPSAPSVRERVIFISHRHQDKMIGDAVHNFINRMTHREVKIYRSTSPESAPTIGAPLNSEIKKQLHETSVVILIFTVADADWSYCMWECGIAMDPDRRTRVVALQFSETVPGPLRDIVRVKARSKEHIHKFVAELMTSPSFFPGRSTALAPRLRPTDDPILDAAEDLHSTLQKLGSPRRGAIRTPHVQVLELITTETKIRSGEIPRDAVVRGNIITLRMFDFTSERQPTGADWTWGHLADQADRPEDADWIAGLGRALAAASRNHYIPPFTGLFKSFHTHKLHQPIVAFSNVSPDGEVRFEIIFVVRPGTPVD